MVRFNLNLWIFVNDVPDNKIIKGTEADPNGLEKVYLKPCEYVSIHLRSKSSLKKLKRISEK